VIQSGRITATACINIGGRLLAYDGDMVITRIEEAGERLLREIGLTRKMGQAITSIEIEGMCRVMASTLVDVSTGAPTTRLAKELMTTEVIPSSEFNGDLHYIFSGGVAEYLYGCETRSFGDLGEGLGNHLRRIIVERGIRLVSLPERIRATVIGASSYTLEVSGPTTYSSRGFKLPIRNVPVTSPIIEKRRLSADYVHRQVKEALKKVDMEGGTLPVALAFKDPVAMGYDNIRVFVQGLSRALNLNIREGVPLVLIFDTDVGNSVGNVLSRETGAENVLALDEISLSEGDFIDVGEPINDGAAYPVVIKSLVF